jgi:hypothetical protein
VQEAEKLKEQVAKQLEAAQETTAKIHTENLVNIEALIPVYDVLTT